MEAKRYNTFSEELKKVFGCRVHRISIDAGFTCPNRDGTVGTGGCIYCGERGSGSFGIARKLLVAGQIEDGKEIMVRKYKARKFIAYFQAYSNTYGPVEHLRKLYDEALSVTDVVGLIVATRPDCLPPAALDLMEEYIKKTYFWLEMGLQTMSDRTLKFINRGHDLAIFVDAAKRCKERGIRVSAHVILGLPGENRDEMLSSASLINEVGIDGIKLHLLHIMKNTPLTGLYERGEIKVMERDEYVGVVCDYLERLRPEVLVQRMTGDGGRDYLVAPLWSLKKWEVLNAIDAEMERRGSFQGRSILTKASLNLLAASGPQPVISFPSISTSPPV
ncbi:MAG: TIGR01212 family radical SAM protein [Deltaproteobacteria bacterium]